MVFLLDLLHKLFLQNKSPYFLRLKESYFGLTQ